MLLFVSSIGCVGKSERKGFLPNSVLHKAGKMARPSAAVRYLSQNMFTTEELSESSTTGNPNRRLKRLDPSKINDIRGEPDFSSNVSRYVLC